MSSLYKNAGKTCYCHTCEKPLHPMGTMRHRKMHRDKREVCRMSFTHGDTYRYEVPKK